LKDKIIREGGMEGRELGLGNPMETGKMGMRK